jgi:5-methylcytosine-specific restriction endonuclease McrA
MKRAELQRRAPLASHTRLHRTAGINQVSKRRQRRGGDEIPATVRRAVKARSGGICECGCGQRAEHMHHRKLRSQGGRHEPVNLLHLTFACHEAAHRERARAEALGLIVPSWADPADVPVTRAGLAGEQAS